MYLISTWSSLLAGDLWLANVGDSRALISRNIVEAQALSVDQKACRMDEIKRIRAAGGMCMEVILMEVIVIVLADFIVLPTRLSRFCY